MSLSSGWRGVSRTRERRGDTISCGLGWQLATRDSAWPYAEAARDYREGLPEFPLETAPEVFCEDSVAPAPPVLREWSVLVGATAHAVVGRVWPSDGPPREAYRAPPCEGGGPEWGFAAAVSLRMGRRNHPSPTLPVYRGGGNQWTLPLQGGRRSMKTLPLRGRERISGSMPLDQFDLVAVRVLDEGDHRGAELHRTRLTADLRAGLPQLFAGRLDVRHT
jgi:hypothetical protein